MSKIKDIEWDATIDAFYIEPETRYRTVSGRVTSPTPKHWKGESTERKVSNYLARHRKWLAAEGVAERAFRGLEPSSIYDAKNLSPSDYDEIGHLLGDPSWEDIRAPRPILRKITTEEEV